MARIAGEVQGRTTMGGSHVGLVHASALGLGHRIRVVAAATGLRSTRGLHVVGIVAPLELAVAVDVGAGAIGVLERILAGQRLGVGRRSRGIGGIGDRRVVGEGLDAVPVDPFTGLPFQYRPDGHDTELPNRNVDDLKTWISSPQPQQASIEANTPFLWGAGPHLMYNHRSNSLLISAEPKTQFNCAYFTFLPEGAQSAHWITNDQELWNLGWCFPVP